MDAPVPNSDAPAHRDIVVVGASAGGTDAITALLQQFTAEVPAAFFLVSHMPPDAQNHLVDILNTAGPLAAKEATDGDEIRHGVVYVAPADRHLLVKRNTVRVTRGPRENRWRPAIDPLFRSAAVAYGPRVIGIVLSGMLDDGTAGLLAIKRCGGVAMVQDPEEAPFPDMPQTALANVAVDHKLVVSDMGPAVLRLMHEPVEMIVTPPRDIEMEARIAETGYSDANMTEELGKLTALSCPECGGPLWERGAGNTTRYRCRVGHAYGAMSLLSAEEEAIESSLWAAVRLFQQRANVLNALAEKDRQAERPRMVRHHEDLAKEARSHADLLRALLVGQHESS